MNSKSIIRLTIWLTASALAMFAIILIMDQRRATVDADSAELFTTIYSIGTDHGGIITQQFVDSGDTISEGQTLFYLNSPSVQEGLRTGDIDEENLLYEMDDEGQLAVTTQVKGVVNDISYNKGSFIPANSEMAEVADTSAIRVRAEFTLPRRDFNKLTNDSRLDIRLPDGSWESTRVGNLRVVEQEELITVQVESNLPDIETNNYETITGAPVQSRIHLSENTLLDRTLDTAQSFLRNMPFAN